MIALVQYDEAGPWGTTWCTEAEAIRIAAELGERHPSKRLEVTGCDGARISDELAAALEHQHYRGQTLSHLQGPGRSFALLDWSRTDLAEAREHARQAASHRRGELDSLLAQALEQEPLWACERRSAAIALQSARYWWARLRGAAPTLEAAHG